MATPFGAYDRAIVEAISQRWYDLLDSQQFADSRTGKVTVDFHLNPDGSVTELKISGNTVGDLLGYVCPTPSSRPRRSPNGRRTCAA
jgi:hypothetical protein